MTRAAISVLIAAMFAVAPVSHADYAVMRSGARLHITGYERTGDRMRLSVAGGTVEVAASDVAAIEPEETFVPNPPAGPPIAGRYAALIRQAAAKHGVEAILIQRVIAEESNFNPRAVSRKDASGLMQILPKTAARYAVGDVFDPAQNIDAGTHYLKDLLEQYHGNLSLALAAYNAGPEMVDRYGGIPPFQETQNYVQRITAELAKVKGGQRGSSGNAGLIHTASRRAPIPDRQRTASRGSSGAVQSTGAAEAAGAVAAGSAAAPGLD